MMKCFYKIFLSTCLMGAVAGLFMATGLWAQDNLLTDLDVPLMTGLTEVSAARVIFDSPEGRIIEAQAEGQVDPGKTRDFYQIVLPSLGWKITQMKKTCSRQSLYCLRAFREKESLTIEIGQRSQKNVKSSDWTNVVFSLNPR